MNQTQSANLKGSLSLSPLIGALDFNQSKHLLNRCLFGVKLEEIISMKGKTAEEAIDHLLRLIELPGPPLGVKEEDTEVPIGTTWVNKRFTGYNGSRIYSYRAWWAGRYLNSEVSLTEKMALFWHNHFVTEWQNAQHLNFNYIYNVLLLDEALGNFKRLTKRMTINVMVLDYLNGTSNVAGSPNENYARELFELFTIGKGPQIADGNYANYTEQDIHEAARVLTGWKTDRETDSSYFNSSGHDKGDKIFSGAFNNRVISNKEEEEYKELIDMIFEQRETARFLARKLYRWFVYYHIDEEIEQRIIEPLAGRLYENDYEIKPVLIALLSSEHFFDTAYRGCMIKNPLEFTAGLFRQLEVEIPGEEDIVTQYYFWYVWLYNKCLFEGMKLEDPPNVAGWPAFYQEPSYNRLWINLTTIPLKRNLINSTLKYGVLVEGLEERIKAEPLKIAMLAENPSDINNLLETLTGLLLPLPATEVQLLRLKQILISGLPDFEWTVEWGSYISNPEDEDRKRIITNKLTNLLVEICSSPQYLLM